MICEYICQLLYLFITARELDKIGLFGKFGGIFSQIYKGLK